MIEGSFTHSPMWGLILINVMCMSSTQRLGVILYIRCPFSYLRPSISQLIQNLTTPYCLLEREINAGFSTLAPELYGD